MQFTKAQRKKAKLRLALAGPSGSGKTWSALLIARGIGGKIAVIDTERDSASLYSHLVDFDSLDLAAPYSPERYVQAIRAAEEAGYDVLVIDSMTHEWNGIGGCLELVDQIAAAKYRGNSWSAWNEVTPRHRAFLDAILQAKLHIIVTMRTKTETAQVDDGGRKKVVKLGMKAEQRDGIEYEFTAVLDITHDGHYAIASKDRTGLFAGKDPAPVTEETGAALLAWLESGAEAPRMSEDALALHLKAFADAKTLPALKAAGDKAHAIAQAMGDQQAKDRLRAAYAERKQALAPASRPAEQPAEAT